jgi:hypothetical protein
MQLTKHISYLLYRYDCVTVPGFGAFLGTPAPAELDTDNDTIYPPTKQISFNAQLQSNDGLLVNAIAVEQQTSYEQAVRLVHKEVVRWKSMLHDGKTIELDRIGKLQFNAEQNVVFVPTKDHNHLADSFGLYPVGYAGFMAYDDYTQDQQLAQEMQLRDEAKQEVQQAVFDLGELPELSIQTIPQEAYHIIGGAFAVESNADRYLTELQQKGFVSAQKLAPNSYGLHMIALGSRVDRTEAIGFLRQVQRTEIADAWMLKR